MIWIFIFFLVVMVLAAAGAALNSHREKEDDEQEFRMYQDPEYRAFIEEKRAKEKAQADIRFRKNLMITAVIGIIVCGFIIWLAMQ